MTSDGATHVLAQAAGHEVRRTVRTLADGREIIYFDDTEAAPRAAVDARPHESRSTAGHVRHDVLTGDWVAIAGHRMNRTFLPPKDLCPLCPTGRGSAPSEIPDADYDVVVFENRFPSYAPVTEPVPVVADGFEARPAGGRTEVVCFTSDHDTSFSTLPTSRVRTVIDAWADRTAELGARGGVAHVYCFENRGQEIGVTLHHPHGQIYAYPYVPERTATMLARAREHHATTGRLLGADVLAAERADGSRVVATGSHWSAYVPFAARWPMELHLAPHRDVPDLAALTGEERDELASFYPELLRRLDRYHVDDRGDGIPMPYIAAWHQAPAKGGREVSRLFLQLVTILRAPGKLKYLAGSESGVGGWVNDAQPESIAARLRDLAG
ncbi:galactose-1-phosphate uridylyltransferase [Oryzobacter sp. R7]|uniref:galactose-1-phosphate uridylyltransferase n=1 Tax=Oryzobacter faecalis TaxID=3388656 RepID=UPI00398C9E48